MRRAADADSTCNPALSASRSKHFSITRACRKYARIQYAASTTPRADPADPNPLLRRRILRLPVQHIVIAFMAIVQKAPHRRHKCYSLLELITAGTGRVPELRGIIALPRPEPMQPLTDVRVPQPPGAILDIGFKMKQRVTELRVTFTGKLASATPIALPYLERSFATALSRSLAKTSSSPPMRRRSSSASANSGFASSKRSHSPGGRVTSETCKPQSHRRLRHPADRFLGLLLRTLLDTKQQVHIGVRKQLPASESSDRAHGDAFAQLRVGSHLFIPKPHD